MPQSPTLYLGLDVHNEAMAVAYVGEDHGAEVVFLGTIGTRPGDPDPLRRNGQAKATPLIVVYEAGPDGYRLSRELTKQGDGCGVVAPSLLPQTAGDRVHTDRRDARPWARLMRSGALTPGDVPTVADDAIRDLGRARDEAICDLKAATFRLKACWLRHEMRSTGRATGSPAPRRGRSEVVCPTPVQHRVLQAYVRAVTEHTARLPRLAQALQGHVNTWRLQPVVEALPAWRGVQCTVAVTIAAAWGELTRVDHPRPRMRHRGLTPAASSRGERRRQGPSTKAGNPQAPRSLVAGAWASRAPAQGSRHLPRRLATRPKPLQDSRWQAPRRRCPRSRPRSARGQHAHPGVVASARALLACMWAMAQEVSPDPVHTGS